MTKRFLLTGFGFMLGVVISALGIALVATQYTEAAQRGQGNAPAQGGQAAQGGARGQGAPPAPCGPKETLPAELGANVDSNSRCFEIRMYTADPTRDGVGNFRGGINELHQRFREKEVELFFKHGAEIIAVWQDLGEPRRLIWMIAYRDRAHREEVWAAFNADPEWTELRNKYFVPLESPSVYFMSATDYSPLK